MKKLRSLALVLAALPFVSCGGGSDESIRLWHAMGGVLGRALSAIVDDYNARAGVTPIDSVSMERYEALSQKIMAAVAAGGPPDLAQCYEAWTANLIENESIVPLSRFLDGPDGLSKESLDDVYEIFLGGASHDGVLWSFPFNKSVRILYYNRSLFARRGLDPDRPPRTWDEYRTYAQRLTVDDDGDGKPDTWGISSQYTVSMFENLIVQNGGSLLDADESRAAFDSPEGREALEFMADLLVHDGTTLLASGFEYQNEFLAGNVGMIEGSSVSLAFIEGKYSFELGLAPLPAGKHDTQLVAGTDVVVFATDPAREAEAWAFVKWFTDTEQTARWSAATGYLPVRKSAMSHPALAGKLASHPGLAEAYAQLDRAVPQPKAPGWYAGRKVLEQEAIEPVLRGILPPGEALAKAARMVNEELAKH